MKAHIRIRELVPRRLSMATCYLLLDIQEVLGIRSDD
jgi:hypothetical protein